jgi:SAM-dependent methyltransferase
MSWSELSEWWLAELASDPAYEEVVTPLLLEVFSPEIGDRYLDLGSGDGRLIRAVSERGSIVHGIELSQDLAAYSKTVVVVAALPDLEFLRSDSYDGAYCVLTLEHIPDHQAFFAAVGRVVKSDGVLAVVMNHPTWTAPGSTPITDSDGEILWRPGDYFSSGSTEEPAGSEKVTFHHRSMADVLNSASDSGWALEQMVERPHHDLEDQAGIPRLLACRWRMNQGVAL